MSRPSRSPLAGASPGTATIVSIFDLGSNSVRLDVAAIQGSVTLLLRRERRMARLGDHLFEHGHADPKAVKRVERALAEFTAIHRAMGGVRVSAVATAAMRAAREAPALVERWRKRYGVAFRIISGAEEASLIAKGVLAAEKTPRGSYGLVDLGGGSTEFIACSGDRTLGSFSVPLGANRAQQLFLKGIPAKKGGVDALRRETRRLFTEAAARAGLPSVGLLIGSGGTVRAVRRMAKAARVPEHPFSTRFLGELTRRMEPLNRAKLLRLPGMGENRLDLILGGAVILEEAARALGASRVRATEAGLRDGLLAVEREALAKETQ